MKIPNVLFFANIPVIEKERSIGGATVLAKEMLSYLEDDVRIAVTHTQIRNFWQSKVQLIDYFIWIFKFPFKIRKYDVISFHATDDYHITIAPILWMWARIFNKKIIYHFFGGNFHEQFQKQPRFIRFILKKTILTCDTVFFETKQLIEFFKKMEVKNIVWLPNSRYPKFVELTVRQFRKRFVFISRIVPQKGIGELMEAAKNLPEEYVIDVYGPIDDRHYLPTVFEGTKLDYKGVLDPKNVVETLRGYDVLVLPSYFYGEGYPGIVIEALSAGLPVITTNWQALPEIIDDKVNGLLVEIKNSEQLREAILYFNEMNYTDFSTEAFRSFAKFNSKLVFNKLVEAYRN